MKWLHLLRSAKSADAHSPILIVGLGNPGKDYEMTRHNLGQMLLKAFAEREHITFHKERKVLGEIAHGHYGDQKLHLLFPTTYMNRSGRAVKKCMDYYKVPKENLLILIDDASMPFGKLRFREEGSPGGHNGLKSVEESLKTREYYRLKLGVGRSETEDLADYVLSRFSEEEQKALPEFLGEGLKWLDEWLRAQSHEGE